MMGISGVSSATHLPILIKILDMSEGPVLEMGMGNYSTPVLNWMCQIQGRKLVSYENNEGWFKKFYPLRSNIHELNFITNWEDADIEKPWTIAFIDHRPGERRKEDIKRLANYAQYVICHDSEQSEDYSYQYSIMYPLFKYKYEYIKYTPQTVVLSNFVDLKNL